MSAYGIDVMHRLEALTVSRIRCDLWRTWYDSRSLSSKSLSCSDRQLLWYAALSNYSSQYALLFLVQLSVHGQFMVSVHRIPALPAEPRRTGLAAGRRNGHTSLQSLLTVMLQSTKKRLSLEKYSHAVSFCDTKMREGLSASTVPSRYLSILHVPVTAFSFFFLL